MRQSAGSTRLGHQIAGVLSMDDRSPDTPARGVIAVGEI
jgi:hypothetical protein